MSAPLAKEAPRRTRKRFAIPLIAAVAVGAAVLALQVTSPPSEVPTRLSADAARVAPTETSSAAATASLDPSVTSTTTQDSSSRVDQAEAFTLCMRDNGVTDFPGITIKENGQIQLNAGGSINPLSATYKAAAKACASTLPSGSTLPTDPEPPSPEAPDVGFTCTEDCPEPPKAPRLPS
jgi:hypothetical protein